MFRILFCILCLAGCAQAQPKKVERPSSLKEAEGLSELPEYQGRTNGAVVPVNGGETVPFDGILMDEEKGFAVAKLRVSYDEVYRIAKTNRMGLLTVIKIQEDELVRADKVIDEKEAIIRDIRDSWWERNDFVVGLVVGLVVATASAVGVSKAVK